MSQAEDDYNRAGARYWAAQQECERLRQELATAESQRDAHLKAIYEAARNLPREFENVTIEELQKMSAGPVEMLD